jgi:hypothetical protein
MYDELRFGLHIVVIPTRSGDLPCARLARSGMLESFKAGQQRGAITAEQRKPMEESR